jgi:transposase
MNRILGVDIAKNLLDTGEAGTHVHRRLPYTLEGLTDLAAHCHAKQIDLVVMEASGNYERQAYLTLSELGVQCAVVNPRAVRNFAKAMGRFEKTDRIDACMIAEYALARQIAAMPPPNENQQKMAALSSRMHQITTDIGANRKRLATAYDESVKDSINAVISLLQHQQADLTARMQAIIDEDPLWSLINTTLRSVKGVANRTVHTLIAEMPELGRISNRAAAKLTGLAPLPDQSGKRDGRRHIHGGRAHVRSMIFLVANIVAKFDPRLADMKQRLLNKGAKKMEARIAIARKLIVWLNAKVRDALRENTLCA